MSIFEENMAKDEEANLESVSIEIKNMLSCTSHPSSQKFSIFRVPDQLRHVNQNAYEPQVIAIGPYGYKHTLNNIKISQMEEQKISYLRSLLERTGHDVSQYVKAMKTLENEARECYEAYNDLEDSEIWKDKFVKMLVLDGCFIVELIRKVLEKKLRKVDDPIFLVDLNVKSILRDILLIENQLPLFVLSKLFEETTSPGEKKFQDLISEFLFSIIPLPFWPKRNPTIEESKHLLDFTHNMWRPPQQDEPKFWVESVPCATELREAGVKFKKAIWRDMFDLSFKNGNLEIPTIIISYQTESLIPNLIAYEQVGLNNNQSCYVTDYSFMMRWLISSAKDAELISDLRLTYNHLGDEVILSQLFEKFVKNATPSPSHFFYSDVQREMNIYRGRKTTALVAKWNLWREKLWQEYFYSPWALISFLAACILLILTLIQTVYSVKSLYQ